MPDTENEVQGNDVQQELMDMIIADESVDSELCATDLLGQAEHGYNSPAVLVTNSHKLAEETLLEIERILKILPTSETASISWTDYGEVIVCDTYEEMLETSEKKALRFF